MHLYCLILSMRVLYKKNTPKGGGYLFSPMLDVLSVGRATNLLSKCHDLYLCAGFKNWGYMATHIWTYGVEVKHDWNQYLLREEIIRGSNMTWTNWSRNFGYYIISNHSFRIGCGLAVICVEPACPSLTSKSVRSKKNGSRMELSKDSLDDRVKLWWIVVWCIWQPQFTSNVNVPELRRGFGWFQETSITRTSRGLDSCLRVRKLVGHASELLKTKMEKKTRIIPSSSSSTTTWKTQNRNTTQIQNHETLSNIRIIMMIITMIITISNVLNHKHSTFLVSL